MAHLNPALSNVVPSAVAPLVDVMAAPEDVMAVLEDVMAVLEEPAVDESDVAALDSLDALVTAAAAEDDGVELLSEPQAVSASAHALTTATARLIRVIFTQVPPVV